MFQATQPAALAPHLFWTWPFVGLLLAIAILPLVPRTQHWWEHNRHKLLVAVLFALATLAYYGTRGWGILHKTEATAHGPIEVGAHAETQAGEGGESDAAGRAGRAHDPPSSHNPVPAGQSASAGEPHAASETADHRTAPGPGTVLAVLEHALLGEYVPFMVLLFSLYVIAGGIVVQGDVRATPEVNTLVLLLGSLCASLIGTTGAAMVFIRFLLKTNSERTRRVHTFVFFIFLVANVGGCLLPIGDPPLFLGYLRGVHFFWTLNLWREWAFMLGVLLVVYYAWDRWAYAHEPTSAIVRDIVHIEPLRIAGLHNALWLAGVMAAVATLDPSSTFPGTTWRPLPYLREAIQLVLAGLSLLTTRRLLRIQNQFNYAAIGEVACLFVGIFITMQVPMEILHVRGGELGLRQPWQFFWACGLLSSFLDNAPAYLVFFETAGAMPPTTAELLHGVRTATGSISVPLLTAISCGAVFMGANTYIGNGPNFMVKAICEQSGVRMPSFFGYMLYSVGILVPLFVVLTLLFIE